MFVSAILAAGGRGARLGAATPKQLLALGDRTILQRSFDTIEAHDRIDEIVVALPTELAAAPPGFLTSRKKPVRIVDGGPRRQDSVANAFSHVSARAEIIVIHDAARPLASAGLFSSVIDAAAAAGSAIAAVPASDTVKEADEHDGVLHVVRTLPRERIYLAQTPQAFQRQILVEAIAVGLGASPARDATDEASLAEQAGHRVRLVEGERWNMKITTQDDLKAARELIGGGSAMRIGIGYDLHRLGPGRRLVIGGVEIPHEMGPIGHSDADVLCHAITDAILGGSARGDIGQHFPDSDPEWKDANSVELLKRAVDIVRDAGFGISNVDAVVVAERPKLLPYIDQIRRTLAGAMGIDVSAISVKGKTHEKVDALGRGEAIAAQAAALLVQRR